MHPALKWTLLVLASLLTLLILIVGGIAIWLSSGSGRDFVIGQAEQNVEGLEITGAAGSVFDLRAERLTMADDQGVWLTVEDLELDWSPLALLSQTLRIELAGARRVALERLPESEEQEEDTGPFELPIDVALDRLALARVELGAALLNGETAVLSAEGTAVLPAGEPGGSAELAVTRIDRPGEVTVDATYVPGRRLLLDLEVREPENGVIAGLLGIPGRPPVEITLAGDGPPTDWTGNLSARAGDVVSTKAEARIRPAGDVVAFGLDLTADVANMLPPEQAELVGRELSLAAGGFVIPGQRLSLDGITLTIAAGTISGQGVYRLDEQMLNFGYSGSIAADSPIRGLIPDVEFQNARITGKAVGPVDAPAVTANVGITELAFDGWSADRLTVTAVTDPSIAADGYGTFGLTTTAVVEGPTAPDPQLTALLGPRTQLEVAGQVTTEGGLVDISRLSLDSQLLDATGGASLANWGETAEARLSLAAEDLAPFSPLAGQDLSGAVGLDLEVARGADGVITAEATGSARNLSTGIPAADALLSPRTELAVSASVGEAVTVPSFRIAGERATITGEAALVDERLTAAVTAEVPDLAPLGDALDTAMAGAATLQAQAEGPVDSFALTGTLRARNLLFQGRRYDQAVLELAAEDLPSSPDGRLTLTSAIGEQPVELATRFALEGHLLRLPELSLQAGANTVQGSVTANLATSTAEGQLTAELPELATIGALAGERLTGSGRAEITLSAEDGRQRAEVEAALSDVTRRLPDDIQRIGTLSLAGSYTAAADGGAAIQARLTGDAIRTGDIRIDRVTSTAEGSLSEMRVGLELNGTAGAPVRLNANGTLSLEDERTRLVLSELSGSYEEEEFQLSGPAAVVLAGEGLAVEDLEITSGDARIAVDADLTGQKLAADARVEQVPLDWARLADPTLELGGQLNGRVTLSGTVADPVGDIDLSIADFSTDPEGTRAATLNADVTGAWRDGRLDLKLATRDSGALNLTGAGSLPLVLEGGPTSFALPPDQPVRAEVGGDLDLSLLNDVLAATGDRVAGRMSVDLSLEGTLDETALAGTVAIAEGRYENQEYGTTIQDITARLDGDPDGLVIREFQGKTPNGGTVTLDGAIRFDPAFGDRQIELTLTADRARVAQTDRITADADAKLALSGSFDEAVLAGNIGIRQAYVTLPDTLPPDIVDLDVVEVNAPAEEGEPPPRVPGRRPSREQAPGVQQANVEGEVVPLVGPEGDGALDIGLKIDVDAPNEIYVRGRGVDAEFQADLDVTGTASDPEIAGAVTLIKGELSILGQTLELARGVITFPGGPGLVPQLDIEARTTRDDITAIISLTGTPDKPVIELSSDPPVPEDEVLARLLFNRGLDQLSAIEAVQLAQGAAQLTGVLGSGPGVLDKVRRGLGVDRLEFRGSETGEGLGTVAAGRYVGDDLYVGLEQDLSTGESGATVEYDINENIQLRGEVGRQSKVGVQFEWDY